jgi:putative ABC transport system ATP-binding protein
VTRPIELEAAERRFGTGHTEVVALHPTTLGVARGELLAIMGPSGSGKTTLLSLVGGLDRATGGRVFVEGKDVGRMNPSELALLRRRTVGYVFQDLNLLAGLTARENVSLPLELDGAPVGAASASGTSPTATPTTCRAASSSGSRSHEHSWADAGSSSPTNPRGPSTR